MSFICPLEIDTACGIIESMTKRERRLERMTTNPQDGWTIQDVITVCAAANVECSAPTRGGHYKISHSSQVEILTIPAHRPVKAIYIKRLVAFLSRVHGGENGNAE